MKVSVPSSYSRREPAKVLEIDSDGPSSESTLQPEPEHRLPLLPAQWWQGFLYGSLDVLLSKEDATRAVDLIANRLAKEVGQLELGASIRSSELRKMIYARFGADLALHTMHELWRQAASNGESPSAPQIPETPENVAKFFEPEDPVPPWRWESDQDRAERERLSDLGDWVGG